MEVKITENKLIEIYCEVDDLLKQYDIHLSKTPPSRKKPTRVPGLSAAEVCTILVAYQMSGLKTFEYFYRMYYERGKGVDFPLAPTYERFLALITMAYPCMLLWACGLCSKAARGRFYVIDSKKLEVCHIKREHGHKVFKDVATKGKSSMGWFFGFKIHLVVNHLCEIVAFEFTPANVADNHHGLLRKLLNGLAGTCLGDKGYITSIFGEFFDRGLHLLTKPRLNMRKLPADVGDIKLLKKRGIIETVNDLLVSVYDMEHSRHRKPINAFGHMLAAIVAYQYQDAKPILNFGEKNKITRKKIAA